MNPTDLKTTRSETLETHGGQLTPTMELLEYEPSPQLGIPFLSGGPHGTRRQIPRRRQCSSAELGRETESEEEEE
jgi:hypothetical protein